MRLCCNYIVYKRGTCDEAVLHALHAHHAHEGVNLGIRLQSLLRLAPLQLRQLISSREGALDKVSRSVTRSHRRLTDTCSHVPLRIRQWRVL